jgi:hypothetical protein
MENKDLLERIFEIQSGHNNMWQDKVKFNTDNNYRLMVMKDFVLGISKQNVSLLESFNWSDHILERIEDSHNSKVQLIDITKYVIGLFILLGGKEKDFFEMFENKSKELDNRWSQLFSNMTENTSVVIFDIDGVIADYSTHYQNFLEDVCGLKKVNVKRKSYSFYETYGITRQEEEQFNNNFVQVGGFKDIPVFDGVVDTIKKLKSFGYKIILVTARPNWIFKRIAADTQHWLKKNDVPYDLLFWNKDKSDVIINNIFPANIKCMVEDRDKHALEVSHIGVDVLLLDKSYNKGISDTDRIKRIYGYSEILDFIKNKEKK